MKSLNKEDDVVDRAVEKGETGGKDRGDQLSNGIMNRVNIAATCA